jgi:hypothetical protein
MSDYPLAQAIPAVRRFRIPLTRDQAMLLMIAVNEALLGVDTYISHLTSGTIVPREWIPILFGPAAGVLLLAAGLLAVRRRMLANLLATVVFAASIVVGLLGAYYHIVRAILPNAVPGQQVSLGLLVWAPPILGPLTFALIGVFGLSAAWQEDPPGSGRLVLPGGLRLQMPFSKTRAYFFLVSLGMLITVFSAVLDHARSGMLNPWVWAPPVIGVFATAVSFAMGLFDKLQRADLITYIAAMLLMLLAGAVGFGLHIQANLVAGSAIVTERFLRGAPFMAPLLFANMGALGLLVLLENRD